MRARLKKAAREFWRGIWPLSQAVKELWTIVFGLTVWGAGWGYCFGGWHSVICWLAVCASGALAIVITLFIWAYVYAAVEVEDE